MTTYGYRDAYSYRMTAAELAYEAGLDGEGYTDALRDPYYSDDYDEEISEEDCQESGKHGDDWDGPKWEGTDYTCAFCGGVIPTPLHPDDDEQDDLTQCDTLREDFEPEF